MALSWRWGRTAALLFTLSALFQVLQPSPGLAVAPSPSESECPELVRTLMELNAPGAASEAIKELRNARPVAEGETPLCALEYSEAAQHQARAVALVQWVQRLQANIAENPNSIKPPQPEPLDCEGKPLGLKVTTKEIAEEAVEKAAQVALICDAHNAEAANLLETVQAKDETAAQTSEKAWTDFKERSLDPWVPVLLGFLVWAAVVLVMARLLLAVLGRFMAPLTPRTDFMKWLFLSVATVALIVSSASSVGLLSVLPVDFTLLLWEVLFWILTGVAGLLLVVRRLFVVSWTGFLVRRWLFARIARSISSSLLILGVVISTLQIGTLVVRWASTPNPWLGAGVGGVAAVLFAVGWGVDRRLTITATGDDAPTAEYLRSLTKQLAPDAPRGVEVPRGTDADVLTHVGIVAGSSTPLVAALARLLDLIRPPTPWQLHVTAPTKDVLTAELTRNHRRIDSVVIDRATSFSFLGATNSTAGTADIKETKEDPSEALDLAPFPAALAVMHIANAHHITQGFAGATRWRSVALQHLAAQQPRSSATAKALFAHAVAVDEKNTIALIGYWHSLYREAKDLEPLCRYRDLLDQTVDHKPGSALEGEPALKLRMLYTYVAVSINLRSAELRRPMPWADQYLFQRAKELIKSAKDIETTAGTEFTKTMRAKIEALLFSVPGDIQGEWERLLENPDRPEAHGPGINYALACYYGDLGGNKELALDHLELADIDPTLKSWRDNDPQLAKLREDPSISDNDIQTNEYRTRFGKTLPTEPCDVAPFSQYALRLGSAGLVTLDQIADAPPHRLMDIGLTFATATWLRTLAQLGIDIRKQGKLKGWEMVIVSEMATRGWTTRPSNADEQHELCAGIMETIKSYKKSPNPIHLSNWISG